MSDKPKVERVILNEDGSSTLRLRHVRLSFPHLFTPWVGKETKGEPKYKASFLLEGDAENLANAKKAFDHCARICYKRGSAKKGEDTTPRNEDKLFLRPCDGKVKWDGYNAGEWYVTASTSQKGGKPAVFDNRKDREGNWARLTEEDNRIYAGCYVNATLVVKANTKFGTISAFIQAVQFAGDGEPFAAGKVNANEEFGDTDPEEDSVDDSGI